LLACKEALDHIARVVSTQRRYGFLYLSYRPRFAMWEIVVFTRKLLLSFIVVFLRTRPATQVALTMMLLLLSLGLNVALDPFMPAPRDDGSWASGGHDGGVDPAELGGPKRRKGSLSNNSATAGVTVIFSSTSRSVLLHQPSSRPLPEHEDALDPGIDDDGVEMQETMAQSAGTEQRRQHRVYGRAVAARVSARLAGSPVGAARTPSDMSESPIFSAAQSAPSSASLASVGGTKRGKARAPTVSNASSDGSSRPVSTASLLTPGSTSAALAELQDLVHRPAESVTDAERAVQLAWRGLLESDFDALEETARRAPQSKSNALRAALKRKYFSSAPLWLQRFAETVQPSSVENASIVVVLLNVVISMSFGTLRDGAAAGSSGTDPAASGGGGRNGLDAMSWMGWLASLVLLSANGALAAVMVLQIAVSTGGCRRKH
jgi:hypothetical protein